MKVKKQPTGCMGKEAGKWKWKWKWKAMGKVRSMSEAGLIETDHTTLTLTPNPSALNSNTALIRSPALTESHGHIICSLNHKVIIAGDYGMGQ